MMKLWKIMVLAMALSLTLTGAFAATYSVPGDYATMAAAQADGAVLAGDTIQVANTHTESNFNPTKSLNYVSWGTTAAAPGAICNGITNLTNTVEVTFDGFTFTNTGAHIFAIYNAPSTTTLTDCDVATGTFALYTLANGGDPSGSVFSANNTDFYNLTRVLTTQNDGDNGLTLNFTDCYLGNTAEFGLSVYSPGYTLNFSNCLVANVPWDAIYLENTVSGAEINITDTEFYSVGYAVLNKGQDTVLNITGGSIHDTAADALKLSGDRGITTLDGVEVYNAALLFWMGEDATAADDQVVTVRNSTIRNTRGSGMVMDASSVGSSLTIEDSVIHDTTWETVYCNGADSTLVYDNVDVYNCELVMFVAGGAANTSITITDSHFYDMRAIGLKLQPRVDVSVTNTNMENFGTADDIDNFFVLLDPYAWGGAAFGGVPANISLTSCRLQGSSDAGMFLANKANVDLNQVVIKDVNKRMVFYLEDWDGGEPSNGSTLDLTDCTIDGSGEHMFAIFREWDITLNNTTLRNANWHFFETFHSAAGQWTFNNSTLDTCGWDGLFIQRDIDVIMNNTSIMNTGFAIVNQNDGGHVGNNTITLDNCSITTNRFAGVEIRKVADVNILNGSDISYNASSGVYIGADANGCNVILDNSSFTYNGDNGMWNDGSNSIDIADCTFDYNEQNGLGGAWNSNGTTLNAVGTSFDHNATDSSDANAAGFFPFRNWDSTFSNCTFNSNGDGINNFGRGVHAWDPPGNGNQMQFSQCQFNNNDGRGIEINNQSITTLTYCQIQNNGAQGIFRSGNNGAVENARLITEMTLDNCDLIGNAEEGIEMYGAGVVLNLIDSDITGSGQTAIGVFNDWLYGESQHVEINAERCTLQSVGTDPGQDVVSIVSGIANLNNCLITGGRYSCVNGAQTRAWDGSPTTNTRASTMTISYCDILGYDGSHGVLAWGSEEVNTTIYNSILDGLSSATVVRRGDGFTTPSIEMVNNIVRGPAPFVEEWGWNFSDNPSSGSRVLALPADNYTSAPLFTSTNTTVLSGDYELQFDSPAIDVADISTYAAATVDIRNFSRDATPDLGAYEFGAGDDAAPTAALSAPSLLIFTPAKAVYTFTVTYYDNSAVSAASLDSSDVVVTGPRGYDEAATFVSASPATDGTPIEVTYTVPAPNGSEWLTTDWGTYTVDLNADQVEDIYNNLMLAETLGTFRVGTMPRAAAKNWELY